MTRWISFLNRCVSVSVGQRVWQTSVPGPVQWMGPILPCMAGGKGEWRQSIQEGMSALSISSRQAGPSNPFHFGQGLKGALLSGPLEVSPCFWGQAPQMTDDLAGSSGAPLTTGIKISISQSGHIIWEKCGALEIQRCSKWHLFKPS